MRFIVSADDTEYVHNNTTGINDIMNGGKLY